MFVSLVLVVAAAASCYFSMESGVLGTQYLVANSNLSSSTPLGEANVTATSMDLGEAESQYLSATEQNLGNWILTRPVNAGELIPVSAVGPVEASDCTQIVVSLGVSLAKTIKIGDNIDLWAADQSISPESIPVQVVTSGELVSKKEATDSFSQAAQSIELCISPAEIRSVVAALASRAALIGVRSQG
jgi:hypothetical protein